MGWMDKDKADRGLKPGAAGMYVECAAEEGEGHLFLLSLGGGGL